MSKLSFLILVLIASMTATQKFAKAESLEDEYSRREEVSSNAAAEKFMEKLRNDDRNSCLREFRSQGIGRITSQSLVELPKRDLDVPGMWSFTVKTANGYICQCEFMGNGAIYNSNCVR